MAARVSGIFFREKSQKQVKTQQPLKLEKKNKHIFGMLRLLQIFRHLFDLI